MTAYLVVNRQYYGTGPTSTLYGFEMMGILLGLPLPLGLHIVAWEAVALVPWAWGVNGLCSVIAMAVGLLLGMACGFTGEHGHAE